MTKRCEHFRCAVCHDSVYCCRCCGFEHEPTTTLFGLPVVEVDDLHIEHEVSFGPLTGESLDKVARVLREEAQMTNEHMSYIDRLHLLKLGAEDKHDEMDCEEVLWLIEAYRTLTEEMTELAQSTTHEKERVRAVFRELLQGEKTENLALVIQSRNELGRILKVSIDG